MSLERWYINVLIKHPYFILLFIGVISCICLVIPLTLKSISFPSFQDPQMGFSTRNTIIANKLTAWNNLQKELRPSGSLVKNPKKFLLAKHYLNLTTPSYETYIKLEGRRRKINKYKKGYGNDIDEDDDKDDKNNETAIYGQIVKSGSRTLNDTDLWESLQNLTNHSFRNVGRITYEKRFCGEPGDRYVHLVITSTTQEDLFTYKNIQSLCKLEHFLMNLKSVPKLCVSNNEQEGNCCKPWSIPNYIAVLYRKHSCLTLTEFEVNRAKQLIQECAKYYFQNKLELIGFRSAPNVPANCSKENSIFIILNYLASELFISEKNFTMNKLEETLIFLPFAASGASATLYHEIAAKLKSAEFEDLSIEAMDFGIKSYIFDEYLLRDARLMVLSAFFVFTCVWIYTKSVILTVMTIISISIVLIVTYFIYEVFYQISFFPFMNMLTIIICIGIGADNSFILCKYWRLNKTDQSNNDDLFKILSGSFGHAFKSMFVTSLTTAVAFFGEYASSVTAISCFSIFAGTAVVINFLLSITLVPACMVIMEKSKLCQFNPNLNFMEFKNIRFRTTRRLNNCYCSFYGKLKKWTAIIWNSRKEFLIKTIIYLRYFWIILFFGFAVASSFIVFIHPGLKLPDSMEFQLFRSSHPFEKYDFFYKNKFLYQKHKFNDVNQNKMPLRFVWGVQAVDNGDHLDPLKLGTLKFDSDFDIVDPESQIWLRDFCNNIQQQDFMGHSIGFSLTSCFMDTFATSMNRRCTDGFTPKNHTPCCNVSAFPFTHEIFNACVINEMAELYNSPTNYLYPKSAGAMFSKTRFPEIRALVVEFQSNISFSLNYEETNKFYQRIMKWFNEELTSAPANLKNGFFISELMFYDLQDALAASTKISVFLSMVLATLVLIISTLNPLLTLIAITTITFSILTTIACLIYFAGWTLNILESVAISTAIGLAIDFSLHYCINYRICPLPNRRDCTNYSLSCLMGPTFMTALTTSGAGFFMLFSPVLPYYQIGLFLVTIMTISWLYATFFLGSLLATVGPENKSCQYSYRGIYRYLLINCCGGGAAAPNNRDTNEIIVSTSSTGGGGGGGADFLDSEMFLKRTNSLVLSNKKKSISEPFIVHYSTNNQGLSDQSTSSNVTIITGEGKPLM